MNDDYIFISDCNIIYQFYLMHYTLLTVQVRGFKDCLKNE